MPLVRVMLAKGRNVAQRREILDGVHEALVEAANVPRDDRFQTLEESEGSDFVFDPTYLGFARSEKVVFVQIFLNAGRTIEVKKALYAAVARNLGTRPGIRPEDVLINLVEVARENWSFGGGTMSYPPSP